MPYKRVTAKPAPRQASQPISRYRRVTGSSPPAGSPSRAPSRTSANRDTQQLVRQVNTTYQRARQGAPSSARPALKDAKEGKKKPGGIFGLLHKIPGVKQGLDVLGSRPVQGVLNVVDKPRAAIVSAAKELDDLTQGEGFSTKDFKAQYDRHMGFGELLQDNPYWFGGKNKIANIVGGLIGDIGLDPLTYATAGVGKLAEGGVVGGGRIAGRKALALGIADRAGGSGVAADVTERLIADAGLRGKGVGTSSNLARAGASAEDAAALGIDKLGVRVGVHGHTFPIPGSTKVADAIEGGKAAVKRPFLQSKSADVIRKARLPEGTLVQELEASKILLGGKGAVKDRANAARVLLAVDKSKGAGGAYADNVRRFFVNQTKKEDLSDPSLIDQLEGFVEPTAAATKVRAALDYAAEKAKTEFGVDFGYIENYVPHRVTQQVRDAAAAGDQRVLKAVKRAAGSRRSTFELERRMVKGEKFLGETLQEGSVREMNSISNRVLGYDFMSTDLTDLLPRYLNEASDAVSAKTLLTRLQQVGGAKPLGKVMKEELVKPTKGQERALTVAEKVKNAEARKVAAKYAKATDKRLVAGKRINAALAGTRNDMVARGAAAAREADSARLAVDRAADAVARSEARLETAKAARVANQAAAASERRTIRKTATQRLARAEKELAVRQVEHEAAVAELDSAAAQAAELTHQAQIQPLLDQIGLQREVLQKNSGEVTTRRLGQAKTAEGTAQVNLQKVQETFSKAQDASRLKDATLERVQAEMDDHLAQIDAIFKNNKIKPGSTRKWRDARASSVEARKRFAILKEYLDTHPNDKLVVQVAQAESDAAALELQAAMGGVKVAKLEEHVALLAKPKYREVVKTQLDRGLAQIGKDLQADPLVQRLLVVSEKMQEPQWWDGLIDHYDTFNNWFKAWAVASPGFLARNGYAGIFNNYLAGVPKQAYFDFRKAFKVYKEHPENYRDILGVKFANDPGFVERFDASIEAIAASGWGQTKQEVLHSMFPRGHGSFNPLKADNQVTSRFRNVNEGLESWMRGSHAMGMMMNGATAQEAIESVTRWHFNYRDLSGFDKMMKRPIPFWVFLSRNVPLQMDVLVHMPHLLNRTYGNLKREIEGQAGGGEDIVPSFIQDLGGIHLPGGSPLDALGEGDEYFMPDLPFLRLQEDLTKVSDPVTLLQDANPVLRLPFENQADKQFFSGLPLTDELEPAPGYVKLPGVKQALEATGLVKEDKQGNVLMSQRHAYIMDSLFPPLSRARRLVPSKEDERYDARQGASILSFLGLGVRTNTPSSQRGELLRRQRALSSLVDQLDSEGYNVKDKG